MPLRSPSAPPPGAAGRRRRLLILSICSLSLFITYLDSTVLNVALPTIQRHLHTGVVGLQWITDGYLLVLTSLVVLSGSVADRVGRRRVFMTGLLLFGSGSLLCSLAPDVPLLVAFRMLQALGGSMLTPVSLSIVRQVFTDPAERARAFGVWSAIFGIGVASGPIIGGGLVTAVGWRSVFWVNLPVVAVTCLLAARYVPESRTPTPRRVDVLGQVLVVATLGTATFGVIEGSSLGWRSAPILAAFAGGAVGLCLLVAVESHRREPLLELRFFRSPPFTAANVIAVGSFFVMSGFLFLSTLYLQEVRHLSPLGAGVALLPATALIAATAPLGGRLLARWGPRLPLAGSAVCIAAGCAVLLGLGPVTPYPLVAAAYALLGAGLGVINPPITNTAVTGMPPTQAGVASAIASSSRQLGNVLGVAVMGAIVAHPDASRGRLSPVAAARFAASTHGAWAVAVVVAMACALVALGGTGRRGRAAAARVYLDAAPAASIPA